MSKAILTATLSLVAVCAFAQQLPPEKKRSIPPEIPTDPTVRPQLLRTAESFAMVKTNYQNWARTEQEIRNLMDAAGQDRKRILRDLIAYSTYDYKPGQTTELIGYGFWSLQAYFSFTTQEVSEVVAPYAQTKDPELQKSMGQMMSNAQRGTWERYRKDLMDRIDKLKALDQSKSGKK
ncbi:MAG: hypothetical protein HYV35_01340 [Lentisphaerae bacterium]|nr:hypothetical protein [Lentisphaerota bacterium]